MAPRRPSGLGLPPVVSRAVRAQRSDIEMLLVPTENHTDGALVFKFDKIQTYFLDNIELVEVTAEASGASRLFVIGEDSRRVELTVGADGRFAAVPAP